MNSLLQQMLMLTVKTDWTRSDVKNVWYIAVMKYELYGLFLRLQISWMSTRVRDSPLWLLSPTVLLIKPTRNDWRFSVSWSSLLASLQVLLDSLFIEFPMCRTWFKTVVQMVSVACLQSDKKLSFVWRLYLLHPLTLLLWLILLAGLASTRLASQKINSSLNANTAAFAFSDEFMIAWLSANGRLFSSNFTAQVTCTCMQQDLSMRSYNTTSMALTVHQHLLATGFARQHLLLKKPMITNLCILA